MQTGPSLRPWSSKRKSQRRQSRTRSERCSENGREAKRILKSFKLSETGLPGAGPHHKDRGRLADSTIKPLFAPGPTFSVCTWEFRAFVAHHSHTVPRARLLGRNSLHISNRCLWLVIWYSRCLVVLVSIRSDRDLPQENWHRQQLLSRSVSGTAISALTSTFLRRLRQY